MQAFIIQMIVKTAILLKRDIIAAGRPEFRRIIGPSCRRQLAPTRISRLVQALALHPDQAEISARGAESTIAIIVTEVKSSDRSEEGDNQDSQETEISAIQGNGFQFQTDTK